MIQRRGYVRYLENVKRFGVESQPAKVSYSRPTRPKTSYGTFSQTSADNVTVSDRQDLGFYVAGTVSSTGYFVFCNLTLVPAFGK